VLCCRLALCAPLPWLGYDRRTLQEEGAVHGKQRLAKVADRVMGFAEADQVEVAIVRSTRDLTRFAENAVHQNVSEIDTQVRVRAVVGKRAGVASTNRIDDSGLRKVAETASRLARLQPENPEFRSLPEPEAPPTADAYIEATAACTPVQRADGVRPLLDRCRKGGLRASGAFSTSASEYMIRSSLGVSAYHPVTLAQMSAVVMGETGSGYACEDALDVSQIDPNRVAEVAIDKAERSRGPAEVEPGTYTVILEEPAVADMVFFLGRMGLGALALQERRSFMSDRLGERVTGDRITIWDDGLDPRTVPFPFDFEGCPKRRVSLIEKGIARGVVYDSFTAGREPDATSTGHGLPSPNAFGPLPTNLFLEPGEATKEEMLAATERGIWVTRFHYTNAVHPVRTVLTGMTRDGTFLIEGGRITRPLKNLRFTQSILDALASADMLGRTLKLRPVGAGPFAVCAPAARIREFTFTGTTQF